MLEVFNVLLGDRPFRRKISYQSVDISNGQVVVFDETTPMKVRNKSIVSSASIPAVFSPVEIDGMYLTDGGTF